MITIKFEIRNNMWGKTKNQIRNILDENKLSCPWNHTKSHYDNIDINKKYARIFINEININDYVLVHENKNENVLLTKILSELKKEISNNLKVVKKKSLLHKEHDIIVADCNECNNSIVEVINIKHDNYKQYLNENYIFENYYNYYRDIDPIKQFLKKDFYVNNFRGSIRHSNIEFELKDDITNSL